MFTSYPPRLVAGEELRRLRVGFSNSCALFGRKHHRSANMSACWFLRHGQGRGGTQALYNSSMGCRKPVRGAVTRPPIVRKDPPPRRHSRPPGTPLTRNSAGFAGFTAVQTGPGQTPEQKNKIEVRPRAPGPPRSRRQIRPRPNIRAFARPAALAPGSELRPSSCGGV